MFETHKHITISIKSYKLHRTLWPRSWCWTLSGFYFIFLTISSLQSTMRFADGQTICRAPVDLKTWLSTDRKHLTTGTSPSSYCAVMVALQPKILPLLHIDWQTAWFHLIKELMRNFDTECVQKVQMDKHITCTEGFICDA